MDSNSASLFAKAYNPFLQSGFVAAVSIALMLLSKVVNSIGIAGVSPGFYWQTATAFLLFYAIFNSIISLSADDTNKYWLRSMLGYLGVALISGLMAIVFSGQSLEEAGAYKWIFIVFTFGYLVFLSIMGLMKTIVNFAEKEVWLAPKKKKNKNKK